MLFRSYPNPAQNNISIQFTSLNGNFKSKVYIVNEAGQKIKDFGLYEIKGGRIKALSISDLATGLYYMVIENSKFKAVKGFYKE